MDIDRASGRQVEFGHEVVEIETISKESDVLSARDCIKALARSLGARREGESGRPVKVRRVTSAFRSCSLFSPGKATSVESDVQD